MPFGAEVLESGEGKGAIEEGDGEAVLPAPASLHGFPVAPLEAGS